MPKGKSRHWVAARVGWMPRESFMANHNPKTHITKCKLEICPKCKEGYIRIKDGTYGKFQGCNRYPECKFTKKLD